MFTLGICNLLGSCVSSMPTCGAFTRSAVSHASGVRTPLAGIYSALITLLALSLLTPYFYFIPKATLAAVLTIAVMFMVVSSVRFKFSSLLSINVSFSGWRQATTAFVEEFKAWLLGLVRLSYCMLSCWSRNRSAVRCGVKRFTSVVYVGQARNYHQSWRYWQHAVHSRNIEHWNVFPGYRSSSPNGQQSIVCSWL